MMEEDNTVPSPSTKKYIPQFRDYTRGYTDVIVPITFERPSHELYAILLNLQSYPHPKESMQMGMSKEETRIHREKMLARIDIQKDFDRVLAQELLEHTRALSEELEGYNKQNQFMPDNRPLAKFGA